jgi:hypothetical protein
LAQASTLDRPAGASNFNADLNCCSGDVARRLILIYTCQIPVLLATARAPRAQGRYVQAPDGTTRLFFYGYPAGKVGYKQFRALLSANLLFEEKEVRLSA